MKQQRKKKIRNYKIRYWVRFFLQAEGGIRDLTVTGVQTCALPISLKTRAGPPFLGLGCGSLRHEPPRIYSARRHSRDEPARSCGSHRARAANRFGHGEVAGDRKSVV